MAVLSPAERRGLQVLLRARLMVRARQEERLERTSYSGGVVGPRPFSERVQVVGFDVDVPAEFRARVEAELEEARRGAYELLGRRPPGLRAVGLPLRMRFRVEGRPAAVEFRPVPRPALAAWRHASFSIGRGFCQGCEVNWDGWTPGCSRCRMRHFMRARAGRPERVTWA